ncbi:hypothetical protein AX15_006430 [Amanita polypyramis BW_CC]|nr:hypothetical protein AX15_006430 [Amanita polypyramis BW_CC]
MRFTFLISSFLLATAALAAPSRTESRVSHRRTHPLQRVTSGNNGNNTALDKYSSNWSGAVWDSYPAGTFKSVTGTFTVPTPSTPEGSASAWVGIDGSTCQSAILQTGIYINYINGVASYGAWYEWFPDYAHDFNGISIDAGDVIRLTVTASSTTSGTAVIENLTKSQTVSKNLTSSQALCGQNAEWIVEDYSSGGNLVPFCNFGTVSFSHSYAKTHNGSKIGFQGAEQYLLVNANGSIITSVTERSTSLAIRYTA